MRRGLSSHLSAVPHYSRLFVERLVLADHGSVDQPDWVGLANLSDVAVFKRLCPAPGCWVIS